ncbi:hypothetical protein SAMN05192575_101522 [Nocardioides alpinus]|uniref:CdiI immunity protein domain-containing protein n=1 Tax=Nocardioides alpinus TaxID=748909 RepID=A0A1I0VWI4_9ACTN|nr:contact-dependent growth inhibition system immunity protein [Nocardioides alpinus]PKH37532.1 hypothetical protein CXG46_19005 [Nocardioides alpinus]SFA80795.1 hypothetical protein SAMN05192575_101522 [Nocardioides alpinus]
MEDLRQLMAAYFHQDWWAEYDGLWESAVDDFARREPDRVAGASDQIHALLDEDEADEALGQTLDDLGNFYDAGHAPGANRAWLQQVGEQLAD